MREQSTMARELTGARIEASEGPTNPSPHRAGKRCEMRADEQAPDEWCCEFVALRAAGAAP